MTTPAQITLRQNSLSRNIHPDSASFTYQPNAPDEPLHFQIALSPCIYIGLHCSRCGEVRQALSQIPQSEEAVCPECDGASSFFVLGSGLTAKALPFHERILDQSEFSPLHRPYQGTTSAELSSMTSSCLVEPPKRVPTRKSLAQPGAAPASPKGLQPDFSL